MTQVMSELENAALENVTSFDKNYSVPKYSWQVPKSTTDRAKKLDYISCFSDNKPNMNLNKVFVQKRHLNPAPNAYKIVRNWTRDQK